MEKDIRVWDEDGDKTRTVERYAYNGQDIVLQTDRHGGVTHRYLHGPMVDQCLADEQVFEDNGGNEAQNVLYPLSDNLGTIRDIADLQGSVVVIANHIVYESYGNVLSETDSSFSTLYGYTGRETDPESDSRPRLGRPLRSSLAAGPHRRPTRWSRSGLSGSVHSLSRVIRSSTPAEHGRLAVAASSVRPSPVGTGSASAKINLSKLNSAPHATPVYASDPALPRRPQDSVSTCPLRL